MAILFFDSFDNTSNTYRRAKYDIANAALATFPVARSGTNGASTNTNTAAIRSLSSNYSRLIFGVGYLVRAAAIPSGVNGDIIFYDGATAQMCLKVNTDGSISIYRTATTAGALLGTSATGVIPASGTGAVSGDYKFIEVDVTFHGSTGAVQVWVDDVSVLNLTGQNTISTANAYANRFGFLSVVNTTNGFDDLYILDPSSGSAPGNARLTSAVTIEAQVPNAAGNYSQWTKGGAIGANNFNQVDDTGNDDTDYISSLTVGQIDTYNHTDLTATSGTVVAVTQNLVAKKDDVNARQIAGVIRESGTDYVGTTRTLTGTYTLYQESYETNPATSLPFSISELNGGVETGIKVIA